MAKPIEPAPQPVELRDWFAGLYLNGAVAATRERGIDSPKDWAQRAYAAADAMIRERDVRNGED